MRQALIGALVASALLGGAQAARAQDYPNRPITVVIPWPPGSLLDGMVRLVGAEMQKRVGQPTVIDFKPGASGTIGAKFVVNSAKPDGYTLFFSSSLSHHPLLNKNNGVDSGKEMVAVSNFGTAPILFVVSSKLPVNSLPELLAYAKSQTHGVKYGIAGATTQLVAAMLKDKSGLVAADIPYKGLAPVVTALLAGEVDVGSASAQSFLTHIQAGSLRPLFVTSNRRYAILPNVQTATEAGAPYLAPLLPNYGMWAPPGTPKAIVDKLSRDLAAAIRAPGIAEQMLKNQGTEAIGSTPEESLRAFNTEVKAWEEAVRLAKYHPE